MLKGGARLRSGGGAARRCGLCRGGAIVSPLRAQDVIHSGAKHGREGRKRGGQGRWTRLDGHLECASCTFAWKSPSTIACLFERSSKHCRTAIASGSVKTKVWRSCYLRKRPFQRHVSLHCSGWTPARRTAGERYLGREKRENHGCRPATYPRSKTNKQTLTRRTRLAQFEEGEERRGRRRRLWTRDVTMCGDREHSCVDGRGSVSAMRDRTEIAHALTMSPGTVVPPGNDQLKRDEERREREGGTGRSGRRMDGAEEGRDETRRGRLWQMPAGERGR